VDVQVNGDLGILALRAHPAAIMLLQTVNVDIAEHIGRNLSSGLAESFGNVTADELGKEVMKAAWKKAILFVTCGDDKYAFETLPGQELHIKVTNQYDKYDLSSSHPSHLGPDIERVLSSETHPGGGLKFRRAKRDALNSDNFKESLAIWKKAGVDWQVDWPALESMKERKKYGHYYDLVNSDIAEHIGRYLSRGLADSFEQLCKDDLGREAVKDSWKTAILHCKSGPSNSYEFKADKKTLHITAVLDWINYDQSGSYPSHLSKDMEKLL